jgi:protein-disulfide isomerase
MLKKIVAGFAFAAAAFTVAAFTTVMAQTAATPASDKPAIEAYIRHLLVWPAQVEVTMGEPRPSAQPGLFAVKVRGTLGDRVQEETFYVSADSRTIVRGAVYAIGQNPFQADIDLLKTENQPFLGTPGAPVSVIEFADFQCPYCKQESRVVRTQLMAAFPDDVKLVYMDFPLESIHPFALGAAVLGRCIYTQNNASFWAYHDWIFEHQSEIKPDNLRDKVLEYAGTDKNLDVAKLTACAVAPEPRADIKRTIAIGDALHLNATPTLFINGRRMVGTVALEDLKAVVEEERAYLKSLKNDTDCCSVQLSLPGMATGVGKTGADKQ